MTLIVPRTSASRSEDLVASKWEKKAAAKETNGSSSTKADAGPSKKSIASKEKEKETEKGKEKEQTKENGGSTSTNGKRSRTEPKVRQHFVSSPLVVLVLTVISFIRALLLAQDLPELTARAKLFKPMMSKRSSST